VTRARPVALALAGLLVFPGLAVAADAAAVPLPTRADLHPSDLGLVVPRQFPNRLPVHDGVATATEEVAVGLGPDGSVRSTVIDQTIELSGFGDYTLEITGPATDVEELPGSGGSPGLRNGSVIWEGFCSGTRSLSARVTMDATAVRLTPLPVSVSRRGDTFRLTNATTRAEPTADAVLDDVALGRAINGTAAALRRGEVPAPGHGDVPAAVPAVGAIAATTDRITLPLRVVGDAGGVAFDTILGDQPLEISAPAGASLRFTVVPALPDAADLDAAASDPDRRRAGRVLQRVLWQVALEQGTGYLGLPLDGEVRASYTYGPAIDRPVAVAPAVPDSGARPVPIALAMVALTALLVLGVRWWRAH
jgi:hypothetical protein